jgi:NAD+ synthase (glutamine-hydrolysing)
MRIAIAQINTTVGDLAGNAQKIKDYIAKASDAKADIVIFPELAVTGYPPEDLLLKPKFVRDTIERLKEIAAVAGDLHAVVGFVDAVKGKLCNAAAILHGGKVQAVYHKIKLPNYGVFDEQRYFVPGTVPLNITIGGVNIGINICEDIWYDEGPIRLQCAAGAQLILVINASPYHAGKVKEREKIIQGQAKDNKVFIAYGNLVGGQDELIFDGFSMAANPEGRIIARADGFREELLLVELPLGKTAAEPQKNSVSPLLSLEEEVYEALLLGIKDYLRKNGFKKVVIGLSGGIDSAIVAALAADALGPGNVTGIFMPTRYSSNESKEDAEELAKNLGISFITVPIDHVFSVYTETLTPHFEGREPDITEENLQARIRGNIIMAFSNKFGWLVLTTGNKSEMSTGYATLYGDMAGGFAVIKDVPKMLVYAISHHRNTKSHVIPDRVLTKAPTAELRPDQKDSDSLPEYEILDRILKLYIENDRSAAEIVAKGFDEATVYKVMNLVDKSEYKRRQSPPGIKITPKAFGRDRRMPITNRYTEKPKLLKEGKPLHTEGR